MTTELVLLGTAGAPMPVAGRGGISSVTVVDERIFTIDCGRGAPSTFAEALRPPSPRRASTSRG
jgi:ribonuclease BN (tRNA processing enzyme)